MTHHGHGTTADAAHDRDADAHAQGQPPILRPTGLGDGAMDTDEVDA